MPTFREQVIQQVDQAIRDGVISAAERDQAITFMSADERRAEFFGGGFMRGADYTRKTMEFAEQKRQEQAALEAERQKFNSQRQELNEWQRAAAAKVQQAEQLQQQLPAMAAKLAAYEQIMNDYNVPKEEIVKIGDPTPPSRPVNPSPPSWQAQPPTNPQQGQFISREDAAAAMREMISLNGKILAIHARHQQIFGTPLMEDIQTEALNAGMIDNIETYWATKYNVPAKQAEIEAKRQSDWEAKIRQEERERVAAEYATDPSRFIGNPLGAPIDPSPVANAFMHSRALQENPWRNADGTEKPPEQRSEIQAKLIREQAAAEYWNKRFNSNGDLLPGVKPPKNYGEGSTGNYTV